MKFRPGDLLRLIFLVLSALLGSASLCFADMPSISTMRVDPFKACTVPHRKLPKALPAIRRIGQLRSESIEDDKDYCERPAECSVHSMEFSGLEISVLSKKQSNEAQALDVTPTSPPWQLLGKIRVGQSVQARELHYGVSIPTGVSPVSLTGECTCLTVWHDHLDCQACI